MLPDPLHPAVVHFPLVLVFLLPLVAAGALWAIRRDAHPRRAWAIPLLFAGALVASAYVALRTGEREEERVEAVLPEDVLHEHEEAAERFLLLSGVLLLVTAAGLFPGDAGRAARALTVFGSLGLVVVGAQVGAAGGELVYRHNAASAYTEISAPEHPQHAHPANPAADLQPPEPMMIEHEAIHSGLEAASRMTGAVGDAARDLGRVLRPHLARENQIALPPLAMLAPLSHGESIPDARAARAIAMSDSLRAELPRMLEEHVRIGAAARRLEEVARAHDAADVQALAHELQFHARMEQEVHYPAAILVGTLLRPR